VCGAGGEWLRRLAGGGKGAEKGGGGGRGRGRGAGEGRGVEEYLAVGMGERREIPEDEGEEAWKL
jgi:hypothetical protein